MSQQLARTIGRLTAEHLVKAARCPTTIHSSGVAGWTLIYDRALYIVITEVDGRLPVRVVRMPKKGTPNQLLAARLEIDLAILWATKKALGISVITQ